MIGEGDSEVSAKDRIGSRGEGEGERSERLGVEDLVDGERSRVEGERAIAWRREGKESRAVDDGGREIKVEGEGDVGCEWVGGVGEGVRVYWRHCSCRASVIADSE